MNELSKLKPPKGARKQRRRIGRGAGSGQGKTAGKGHKGQKARSGGNLRPGFEGGQMPLQRRLPKRGFKPIKRTIYAIVNVSDLDRFDEGAEVTPESLAAKGLVRKPTDLVKILGNGELTTGKLTIKAHKFSKAAVDKIAGAGGTVEVIGG